MRLLRERRSEMSRIMKWADCFDEELRKDEEPEEGSEEEVSTER